MEAALINTVSPRESQEKSVAASATFLTATVTSSPFAPSAMPFSATSSLASENWGDEFGTSDPPLEPGREHALTNSAMDFKKVRRSYTTGTRYRYCTKRAV